MKIGFSASGMLTAATFLTEFRTVRADGDGTETIPWAHLDISGPADTAAGAHGVYGPGATGVSVRTLVVLAETFSA